MVVEAVLVCSVGVERLVFLQLVFLRFFQAVFLSFSSATTSRKYNNSKRLQLYSHHAHDNKAMTCSYAARIRMFRLSVASTTPTQIAAAPIPVVILNAST